MSVGLKRFWPAGLAVLAAVVVASVNYSMSRSQRLTNLRLDQVGFPTKYVVFDKADRKRCFVVNRREATMRRSDDRQPGSKWHCRSFVGESGSRAWFLQSKRIGAGTIFVIPAVDVQDWSYPFLYDFVRQRRPELDLPEVRWVQLYMDRVFQGLYLWVELPFDKRKRDGGSGVLRELIVVRGNSSFVVNTRFMEARNLYVTAVADGKFPTLNPPSSEIAWLARHVPTPETTLLMSNVSPFDLSLIPYPVALGQLYELKNQRPATLFTDDRYRRWTEWSSNQEAADSSPFSEDELNQLRSEFGAYADRLLSGLRAQAIVNRTPELLVGLLPQRQSAIVDLGLSLGASERL
jgi:hypothetical protein